MLLNPLTLVVILVCAFFFFCASKFEGASGTGWAGLSIVISVVACWLFHGRVTFILLGQSGLFVGITVFRARIRP